MSEFSIDEKNVTKFLADYYPINGYSYQYMSHPLEINQDELLRIYLINMGTTIHSPMHRHSTIFDVYTHQDYFPINHIKLNLLQLLPMMPQ
jgi:nitrite reductase (NO-forming)